MPRIAAKESDVKRYLTAAFLVIVLWCFCLALAGFASLLEWVATWLGQRYGSFAANAVTIGPLFAVSYRACLWFADGE
jgi:hypothetical protein